jgi:hypothetical protein
MLIVKFEINGFNFSTEPIKKDTADKLMADLLTKGIPFFEVEASPGSDTVKVQTEFNAYKTEKNPYAKASTAVVNFLEDVLKNNYPEDKVYDTTIYALDCLSKEALRFKSHLLDVREK